MHAACVAHTGENKTLPHFPPLPAPATISECKRRRGKGHHFQPSPASCFLPPSPAQPEGRLGPAAAAAGPGLRIVGEARGGSGAGGAPRAAVPVAPSRKSRVRCRAAAAAAIVRGSPVPCLVEAAAAKCHCRGSLSARRARAAAAPADCACACAGACAGGRAGRPAGRGRSRAPAAAGWLIATRPPARQSLLVSPPL